MTGPPRSLTKVLALGAGLLVAATLGGAPASAQPAVLGAVPSSAVDDRPSLREVRAGVASRSLPQSGRRAVPPLRFPGFGASERALRMPDVRPASASAQAVDPPRALQTTSSLVRPTVWAAPRLPWS